MKKIFAIILPSLLAFAACVPDERNNFMVDDSLCLIYDEVLTPVSICGGGYDLTVLKSGKGQGAGTASLSSSSAALAAYNEVEGTEYSELSQDCYSFESSSLDFAVSDIRKTVNISWDVAKAGDRIDSDNYVIPVSLQGSGLEVNGDRSVILLNLLKSTVSFASGGSTLTLPESKDQNATVTVKLKLDRAIPLDLRVAYSVDNSLVAPYNDTYGTSMETAPEGFVVVPSEPAVIEKGKSDVYTEVVLDNSVLFGSGDTMMDFDSFLVPLRITSSSVDGLLVSEEIYYLVVNSPFSAASFSRMWGKYSLPTYWGEAYGLPAGADRNLATDGTYVYLPYAVGGTTARITAVSVADPDVVKMVNFEGAVPNTITSACVRVIDKGDGTTMLVASGASDSKFNFYAWENGIDAPPTVFTLGGSWRRHGDRIEFKGTWKDGELWAHAYQGTFSSCYTIKDGTFTAPLKDGAVTVTLVDAPFTGFGGSYWYPGQEEMVFATSDTGAYMTLTGTTRIADIFTVRETVREEVEGFALTFGYRPFEFKGEKYIAFTTFDKNDETGSTGNLYTSNLRARLVVVEDKGGFRKSLDPEAMNVVFEAPLQSEEFEVPSAVTPSSLQADCSVAVLPDRVIIAAGAQGLGLSVFKLE